VKPSKKPPSGPSAALLAAIEAAPERVRDAGQFEKLKSEIGIFRDLKFEKNHLEERLKEINKKLEEYKFKNLPELMDNLGVAAQTLEAAGNLPRGEIEVKPYYRANIPADWDPEKRAESFSYLDAIGEGELIKTEVVVSFPREARKKALDYMKRVEKAGFAPIVKEAVHHGTLTSWLKFIMESPTPFMVERGGKKEKLDLEKIGGTVGRIADFKEKLK
jgi:hypothetical protein